MGSCMPIRDAIAEMRNIAKILTKISDSNILGDGTRESCAVGRAATILNIRADEMERNNSEVSVDAGSHLQNI